jgi:hypothetical protein
VKTNYLHQRPRTSDGLKDNTLQETAAISLNVSTMCVRQFGASSPAVHGCQVRPISAPRVMNASQGFIIITAHIVILLLEICQLLHEEHSVLFQGENISNKTNRKYLYAIDFLHILNYRNIHNMLQVFLVFTLVRLGSSRCNNGSEILGRGRSCEQ